MTAIASPCTQCQTGDLRGLERTRFFARQLVSPDDLTQDQIYFREKAKRHNRMLHGWGVVCGACVRRGANACEVIIEPGYVLGPYGDEIVIDRETVVDICKLGGGEQDGCCDDDLDPWCSDARTECAQGTLYLAIKYNECMARPVRGGGACGCGCDESDCEYSRIRDNFTVKLLRELPAGYTTPMTQPPFTALDPCRRSGIARNCPPCPKDPWVILADVMIGTDCKVRSVNCFTHRRYVVSFADFFLFCASSPASTTGFNNVGASINIKDTMRMMSMMSGTTSLMDTRATMSGEAPRAMVALTRVDGSTAMLPAYFTVERGMTVRDLLEREGDREYYDPATDLTHTLREIYDSAGVPPSTRLDGTAAALSPLEGRILGAVAPSAPKASGGQDPHSIGRARSTKIDEGSASTRVGENLRDAIDPSALSGLQSEEDAAGLPATSIVGVAQKSALGKRLADFTVSDVGGMTRAQFVSHATKGIAARQKKQVTKQAEEVWERAQRITAAARREPDR